MASIEKSDGTDVRVEVTGFEVIEPLPCEGEESNEPPIGKSIGPYRIEVLLTARMLSEPKEE